ncbi:hypothetical protein BN10_1240016 [Phycicoccus elongatus Lp2]|uniref:Uncharacterized protein n=1 Tax=Phycicoccus elongatus Lp2 TaxID=1193181 RepID=N0DXZ7_9MICO|nr:hypothetical protein BN10_1240016 [Phycicoccus elongatus Lp2]
MAPRDATGTTIWVGWEDTARAVFTVADEARPTSRAAIADLVTAGLTPTCLPAPAGRPPRRSPARSASTR